MKNKLMYPILTVVLVISLGCQNPFSTREPKNPGTEGAAIKPPISPENVLYNLASSFEGLSIQDYLDVFSEDFAFNPDTEDSLEYEEYFVNGWDLQNETEFANNFIQPQNFTEGSTPIDIFANYEYKPGENMYEYNYTMFISFKDTLATAASRAEVEGRAWLYLREDDEGKWSIYRWVDFRLRSSSLTWGVLRAQNI